MEQLAAQAAELTERASNVDLATRPCCMVAMISAGTRWSRIRARDAQAPEQDRQSLYDPHMVRKLSTYALVLLIMNVFPIPRPGCLRLRVRKVAAMRHRRDVFDVLSLIDQSTVDLSVFDTSVCAVS